jgi:NAD(P)-dependent dehydrogenase (short-subunit alcohol dehydrogenase family)
MVEAAMSGYGSLDILFNNVGISRPGTVVDVEEEDWDTVLDVNLKSMMLTSGHAIPMMSKANGAAIVNVSSIDGLRAGWSRNIAYAAAKAGVIGLTRNMAIQHGRENIRVKSIAPGHLHASLTGSLSESHREMRRRANALGAEGTAWDVAWAAVFLASDESRWITGVVLPVDAGALAAHPLSILPRDPGGILPEADNDLHFPP